jgi:radical SAM-linked protein
VKLRIRSTKLGKVRFVGHRDVARLWERTLRKAGLPLASSAGFTPRPKLSFGLALPVGAESLAEYVDVELRDGAGAGVVPEVDLAELPATLSAALPVGLDVTAVAERPDPDTSLQDAVTSCTWQLWGPDVDPRSVVAAVDRLLAAERLPIERERKGERRVDDVRPVVLDLHPDATGSRLVAELATVGRGLRPAELASLAFPGVDPVDVRVLRTHQWIDRDGDRREVLPARSLPAGVGAHDPRVGA